MSNFEKIHFIITLLLGFTAPTLHGQILDKQTTLEKFAFWTNKDWDWYKENIPFLETPDRDIDLTYYYRWEMMSGKMVYGSPESGYASTEFTDRPWWSGSYGTISCPAGHQLYEFRWFKDRKYAEDYATYWFKDPGAEPFNYTNWIGDAVWAIYKVYKNERFVTELQDDLIEHYLEWEKKHYVPSEGMFAWDGMHDGMETNINSRQTEDWFAGAPGYRPTLNSYMWAHALAIKNIAKLSKDTETAEFYQKKANTIKESFLEKNWDEDRNFFFHRFQNDEKGGIKANTLTYETGEFAGSPHGREEMGYVPWYFNLPDQGYEIAWQYLMDPDYFFAPYGPTTVEQQDPLFKISERCCEWSGNAWPFATSQTLKAMANVIKYYDQKYVSREDYVELLQIYARTHRKDGKPYIAEANHPFTGSWQGHNVPNHSEHYFHSSYIDPVITGLIGFEPKAADSVEVNPLVPEDWDYFALDGVTYHGNTLSVIWDRDGRKYNRGKGLLIIADGETLASSPTIERIVAYIPEKPLAKKERLVNYAVNNDPDQFFPRARASFPGIGNNNLLKLNDGQYWYYTETAGNRWTSEHSSNEAEYVGIDFGIKRPVEMVKLYLFSSEPEVVTPVSYKLEYKDGNSWKEVPGQEREPKTPTSGMANVIKFSEINTSAVRINFTAKDGKPVGVTELEAWGRADFPIEKGKGEIKNLAYHKNTEFSTSYISRFDDATGINDGVANPAKRWTAFESLHKQDWIQFDFRENKEISKANLFIYDDKGGIQPPADYTVQYWNGKKWRNTKNQIKTPEEPIANLNQVLFDKVKTSKVRILFTHKSEEAFTGIYEVEFY